MLALKRPAARDVRTLAAAALVAAGFYWAGSVRSTRRAPVVPTEKLRLVDEIQPLRRRWLTLDARLMAAEAAPRSADWPELLKDGTELLGDSAQIQWRFAQDMSGLVAGRDKATGLPREELAARSYFAMDELGSCILRAAEQARLLHASLEGGDQAAAKAHAKAAGRYARARAACLGQP
jgi:hypothetical protein